MQYNLTSIFSSHLSLTAIPSGCVEVPHNGFDSHVLNYQWYQTSFSRHTMPSLER